jgi:membrane protein implicated in regulation of membrane protease activity
MTKRTKIALIAGTTVLALAGIGGGVAFAASGGSGATPIPNASLAASTVSGTPSTGAATPKARQARSLLARVEHGEVTLRTKKGDETVDIQRGQVAAVSATTVTVRSPDGFTATYTLGTASKVLSKGKASTIGDVHDGDRVNVLATRSGNTLTVRRLGDPGPAPTK